MKKHFAILAVLISAALCGCTSSVVVDPGTPVYKVFQIAGDFDALYVANAFDVYVDDSATDVTITVGENIISKVIVEQVGGKLKIYCKPHVNVMNDNEMKAVIPHSSRLKDIELSGASSFNSPFPVVGKNVNIEVSGASRFFADLSCSDAEIELSGASRIKGSIVADGLTLELSGASVADLTGPTGNLELNVSGASRNVDNVVLNCYGLECNGCKGSISGASKAYIHCNGDIDVSLSGASDLHYTGDATTSGSSTSGASNIIHDRF